MTLLTMTDCSNADNRVQARYELDSAEDGTDDVLGKWARKWARPLIVFAENAPSEDDIASDLAELTRATDDAENHRDELKGAIEDAIKALDEIDADALVRKQIDDIIGNLENA